MEINQDWGVSQMEAMVVLKRLLLLNVRNIWNWLKKLLLVKCQNAAPAIWCQQGRKTKIFRNDELHKSSVDYFPLWGLRVIAFHNITATFQCVCCALKVYFTLIGFKYSLYSSIWIQLFSQSSTSKTFTQEYASETQMQQDFKTWKIWQL